MNTGKMTCNMCGVVRRFRAASVQRLIDRVNESGWRQVVSYPWFDRESVAVVGDFCPECFAALADSVTPYELSVKLKTSDEAR